jgi:hypothetical protein
VARRWAIEDQGIAYESWLDVCTDVQMGRLEVVMREQPGETAPLALICTHRKQFCPAIRQLHEVLKERVSALTALSPEYGPIRVRPAHRDYWRSTVRDEEWLLIEWPDGDTEPLKCFLTTAPEEATLEQLVVVTKMRWRIERDYQDLKQEFGLGHYEGRGWRGFHHHATLSIAAYGFLMAQRLRMQSDVHDKKTSSNARCLPFPRITSHGAVQRAQRHVPDSITTLRILLGLRLTQRWHCSCTATDCPTNHVTQ